MALPYTVDSLDNVPEGARDFYAEADDGFTLDVDLPSGTKMPDEVSGLENALRALKKDKRDLTTRVAELEPLTDEVEELRAQAEEWEEGQSVDVDALREKIQARLEKDYQAKLEDRDTKLSEYEEREAARNQRVLRGELRSAIASSGVKKEYYDAVEALLERKNPNVSWGDDGLDVVIPDDVYGDKPLTEFIDEWAKSDEAQAFMPPPKGGGGATGQAGSGAPPSNKKYGEMSIDDKVAYLDQKYGGDQAA